MYNKKKTLGRCGPNEYDSNLARDELHVGHGKAIDKAAVDQQSDLDRLVGKSEHVRKEDDDRRGLRVPLECRVSGGGACRRRRRVRLGRFILIEFDEFRCIFAANTHTKC